MTKQLHQATLRNLASGRIGKNATHRVAFDLLAAEKEPWALRAVRDAFKKA